MIAEAHEILSYPGAEALFGCYMSSTRKVPRGALKLKVDEGGTFRIVREATEPVAPDPYLVELENRSPQLAADAVHGGS